MANLRLRRLEIRKFRNVVPGTELVFSDGMNVLLGRNGTGKTTLLQLIAAVTSSSFEPLADEDFDIEYDLLIRGRVFRVSFSNRTSQSSQARTVRKRGISDAARTEWSFRASMLDKAGKERDILTSTPTGAMAAPELRLLKGIPVRDPLRDRGPIDQAIDVILMMDGIPGSGIPEAVPGDAVTPIKEMLDALTDVWQSWPDIVHRGGRFDEGLGTFGRIVSELDFLPGADARRTTLLHYSKKADAMGAQFAPLEVLKAALEHIQSSGVEDVRLADSNLPFLRRFLDLIHGREGRMIVKLEKEESPESGGDATFGDFEFLITMLDGSVFRHDYLSYGQKRLLSFLYYAAANPDIIIADELVNGLHHEWIEACLDDIADRQCFLTSQNPLLLDYLSFDSEEQARRTFLLCDRTGNGGRAQFVWQHMDQGSAEAFFRAYRAGLQHVSEILRTKGLW